MWADSYERDFSDVLALQSDVATAIARGIQVELSEPEVSQLASRRPIVPRRMKRTSKAGTKLKSGRRKE